VGRGGAGARGDPPPPGRWRPLSLLCTKGCAQKGERQGRTPRAARRRGGARRPPWRCAPRIAQARGCMGRGRKGGRGAVPVDVLGLDRPAEAPPFSPCGPGPHGARGRWPCDAGARTAQRHDAAEQHRPRGRGVQRGEAGRAAARTVLSSRATPRTLRGGAVRQRGPPMSCFSDLASAPRLLFRPFVPKVAARHFLPLAAQSVPAALLSRAPRAKRLKGREGRRHAARRHPRGPSRRALRVLGAQSADGHDPPEASGGWPPGARRRRPWRLGRAPGCGFGAPPAPRERGAARVRPGRDVACPISTG